MIPASENHLSQELASELESKFFWWGPVGSGPRSNARILAQAMNLASFADVRRLEGVLGTSISPKNITTVQVPMYAGAVLTDIVSELKAKSGTM